MDIKPFVKIHFLRIYIFYYMILMGILFTNCYIPNQSVVFGSFNGEKDLPNHSLYENASLGIKFNHPSHWNLTYFDNSSVVLVLTDNNRHNDTIKPGFIISKFNLTTDKINESFLVNANLKNLEALHPGIITLSNNTENITSENIMAHKFEFSTNEERILVYMFKISNEFFIIEYSSPQNRYLDFLDEIGLMVKSIEFT